MTPLYLVFKGDRKVQSFPITHIFDEVPGKDIDKLLIDPIDCDRLKNAFDMNVYSCEDVEPFQWEIALNPEKVTFDDDDDDDVDDHDDDQWWDDEYDDIDETDPTDLIDPSTLVNFFWKFDSHWDCYCKTQTVCGCGCDPLHDGW